MRTKNRLLCICVALAVLTGMVRFMATPRAYVWVLDGVFVLAAIASAVLLFYILVSAAQRNLTNATGGRSPFASEHEHARADRDRDRDD